MSISSREIQMVTADQDIESFEAEYGVKVEVMVLTGDAPIVVLHADTRDELCRALREGWAIPAHELNDWVQPERSAFDEANPYQS